MSDRRRLVLFTRYPTPGQTKTRLIPRLGAERAAAVTRELVERLLQRLRPLPNGQIELRFEGASVAQMRAWLGAGYVYTAQVEGDLGLRMAAAFRDAESASIEATVLCGSDIPALDYPVVARAFAQLETRDIVLGPASDGGYYLVGMRTPARLEIFDDISWSTELVLRQTVACIERLNASYAFVDRLDDLDNPEDLDIFRDDPLLGPLAGP